MAGSPGEDLRLVRTLDGHVAPEQDDPRLPVHNRYNPYDAPLSSWEDEDE